MRQKFAIFFVFLSWAFFLFPSFVNNSESKEIKTIHVYVALCDNKYQGIAPVKPSLGNGDDPGRNLYWGAMYGIKSYFKRSSKWQLLKTIKKFRKYVLERCIFKYRQEEVYLVADAYRGRNIKEAIIDFLKSASDTTKESVLLDSTAKSIKIPCAGSAELIVFLGHNGLMDFDLDRVPKGGKKNKRKIIILACKSKSFFQTAVKSTAAFPLLWTTGFMAPEAYTLEAAVAGWIARESNEAIRQRAIRAYHRYQRCGIKAAAGLFVSGW